MTGGQSYFSKRDTILTRCGRELDLIPFWECGCGLDDIFNVEVQHPLSSAVHAAKPQSVT